MPKAIILESLSDVDYALQRSGLYVVQSGSDAFFPVKGLVEDNIARVLGEFYTEDNKQLITVEIVSRNRNGVSGLGIGPEDASGPKRTISIGREFFVTAFKDYHDWQTKWWREAVQNSVDAGGRNVELGVTGLPNEEWLIYCDDDGRGMDEDTIINKFLVLGASTKTSSSGTAGGFGKAKELLLLPWISWRIHSRDTIVEGAGIDYSVSKGEYRTGTRLEVVMPEDKSTTPAAAIAFLEKCYLPHINFSVRSALGHPTVNANLPAGNLIDSVDGKVDVYFTPFVDHKKTQSYMYVRTHGIFMFSRYIGDVPGHLLAEIVAPSIEILTANRDGFRDYEVQSKIENLGARIAKDNMSALRSKAGLIRKKYEGSGKFKARKLSASMLENIGPQSTELSDMSVAEAINIIKGFITSEENMGKTPNIPSPTSASAMLDMKFRGPSHVEAAIKQLVWDPDFYIMNDIEGFKVPKKFFPETMTGHVVKLAKTWVELCRYVLMQLGSDVKYGVGFYFSEHTAAAAMTEKNKEDDDEHWLMLNPFKDFRRRDKIWKPTENVDLKWLYAAAIHECTHIADDIQYHDESFAAALTYNMARCADGYRKIKEIVSGIRMQGSLQADIDE